MRNPLSTQFVLEDDRKREFVQRVSDGRRIDKLLSRAERKNKTSWLKGHFRSLWRIIWRPWLIGNATIIAAFVLLLIVKLPNLAQWVVVIAGALTWLVLFNVQARHI